MMEREMEDLLWDHPEKLLGEQLSRFERQAGSGVGRADLIFIDRLGRFLVVEVKRGKLQRGAIDQLYDYYGVMKRRFPDKVVELMVVANQIPDERRLACDRWDIETREISDKRFRDVASEVGYTFASENSPRDKSDGTQMETHVGEPRDQMARHQDDCERQDAPRLRWARASLREGCFDLELTNPEALDANHVGQLLKAVQTEDGVNPPHFNTDAGGEFERWLANLHTPLREQAYARLSNWFLTEKADCRGSPLAQTALELWRALFCAEPGKRLTHPKKDHKILPEEFDLWWSKQLDCQNR
jgi:hypothetical protein